MSDLEEFFGEQPEKIEFQLGVDFETELAKHSKLPHNFCNWSRESQMQWLIDQRHKRELWDWRVLAKKAEERTKTALESIFGCHLKKDGDYRVVKGGPLAGQSFFTKKNTDYVGSTPWPGAAKNASLYVEVKSMSPYQSFDWKQRLCKRRTDKRGRILPSQHDKMTTLLTHGDVVWLSLVWWTLNEAVIPVEKKGKGNRKVVLWPKENLVPVITLIEWDDWLKNVQPDRGPLKYKNISTPASYLITKSSSSGRWMLSKRHWGWKLIPQKRLL